MIIDKYPAAPGDTLLGRLQRGTGAGYLEALDADADTARVALKSAIRLDWRWDRQLDSRSWYYACLADHLGLTSGDVENLILSTADHDHRDAADEVAVRVLGQFASWGDASAVDRLIEYVRYGSSPDITVEWCVTHGTTADLDRLRVALASRFPSRAAVATDTATLSDLAFWLEPLVERDDRFHRFVRLIDSVEQARGVRQDRAPSTPPETLFANLSFEDACHAFVEPTYFEGLRPDERRDMISRLGEQCNPGRGDWLMQFLFEDHPQPSPVRLLATILPPDQWPSFIERALADGRAGLRRAGADLLERSERPAVELVVRCIRSSLVAGDMYSVCSMLDIIKRERLMDLIPDVEITYREATYSFGARLRAVETLERLTPDRFREQYARECLWDCEESIIEIGCHHVGLDDLDVRPRLEFLRFAFERDSDGDATAIYRVVGERLGY